MRLLLLPDKWQYAISCGFPVWTFPLWGIEHGGKTFENDYIQCLFTCLYTVDLCWTFCLDFLFVFLVVVLCSRMFVGIKLYISIQGDVCFTDSLLGVSSNTQMWQLYLMCLFHYCVCFRKHVWCRSHKTSRIVTSCLSQSPSTATSRCLWCSKLFKMMV